ncbi:MAG: hypothetical protein NTW25_00330 [Candidatus Kapabacteria bacterium]|nr:hypothetical protein [Candidatus Kapabacteria bacterium]
MENVKISKILVYFGITSFFIVDIVLVSYFYCQANKEQLGQFGDFFGGTLNPILSLCGFIAILCTIKLQAIQINQNKQTLQQQQFESTFFTLFKLYNSALTEILDDVLLQKQIDNIFCLNATLAKNELNKFRTWNKFRQIFFSILNLIHNYSSNNKVYIGMIDVLIDDETLMMLYIDCHIDNANLKELMEKYSLFNREIFHKDSDYEVSRNFLACSATIYNAIYDAKKYYNTK